MTNWIEMVKEFHAKFGYAIGKAPSIPEKVTKHQRLKVMKQEFSKELCKGIERGDLEEIADGCADSIYTIIGTAIAYGIDLIPIFEAVHEANMKKEKVDGPKPKKPEGWEPPPIRELLIQQGMYVGEEAPENS